MSSSSTDGISNFLTNNLIGVLIVLHVFMFIFWFIWEPGFWIIFWLLTVYCVFMFFYEAPYKALDLYKDPTNTLVKPITLFNTVACILFFYIIVFIFGIPMNEGSKDIWITLLEAGLWTFLTFVIFLDFFYYVMHTNLISSLSGVNDQTATNYIVNLINGYTPTQTPIVVSHTNAPVAGGSPSGQTNAPVAGSATGQTNAPVVGGSASGQTNAPVAGSATGQTNAPVAGSASGQTNAPVAGSAAPSNLIPVPNGSNARVQLYTTPPTQTGYVDLYAQLPGGSPFLLSFRKGVEPSSRDNMGVGGMYNDIVAVDVVPMNDGITNSAVEIIIMSSSGAIIKADALVSQQTLSSGTWPAGTVYKVQDQTGWNEKWNNYIMLNPQLLLGKLTGSSSYVSPTPVSSQSSTTIPQSTPVSSTTVPLTTPVSTNTLPQSTPVSSTTLPQSTTVSSTTVPLTTLPQSTPISMTTVPLTTLPQSTTVSGFQNMSEGFTTSVPPQNMNNSVVPGRLVQITTPLPPTTKPVEPTSQPYLWSDFKAFVDTVFNGNQLSSQPVYSATSVPPSIEAMSSPPALFSDSLDVDILGNTSKAELQALRALPPSFSPSGNNEVYHVSGNNYTYPEAQAVCRAFGAKLATYEQIEEAYNDGADWINYGWSADQYAYFPLQKSTWQQIQNAIKANGGQCPNKMLANVRPGISGGYFANPHIRFGVNCYGVKPPQRSSDNMGGVHIPQIPSLPDPVDQLAQMYQKNLDQFKLDSFDAKQWSEYN